MLPVQMGAELQVFLSHYISGTILNGHLHCDLHCNLTSQDEAFFPQTSLQVIAQTSGDSVYRHIFTLGKKNKLGFRNVTGR